MLIWSLEFGADSSPVFFVVVGKGKEDGMELYHIDRSLCKQIKVTLKPNQKSGKYHKKPKRIQNRFDSCPKFRRPLVKFIRPEVWLRLPYFKVALTSAFDLK